MRPRGLRRGVAEFVEVAKAHDIPPGSSRIVVVAGHPVAVFHAGGGFYALENVCLHRGGPVGEGHLEDLIVTCPWHGWQYDVRTGENVLNPMARIRTFRVKVEGDAVLVAP